jgi:hypothetical protein
MKIKLSQRTINSSGRVMHKFQYLPLSWQCVTSEIPGPGAAVNELTGPDQSGRLGRQVSIMAHYKPLSLFLIKLKLISASLFLYRDP